MDQFGKDVESRMKKAIESTQKKLAGIRTGRANPSLLDPIKVEYYGAEVPLIQLANISAPESRLIVIQPYDKSSSTAIEKAIQKSGLGLTPNSEGGVIRLNIPQLTEERRRDLAKVVKKEAEEGKVVIRNNRREVMDELKKSSHSEDEKKFKEEEVEKITAKSITEIDKIYHNKEKEIMEV